MPIIIRKSVDLLSAVTDPRLGPDGRAAMTTLPLGYRMFHNILKWKLVLEKLMETGEKV